MTKDKILQVSINLFSEFGYDNVSIRQIAKEVGIKESSIYNHYKSKESILETILDYYINNSGNATDKKLYLLKNEVSEDLRSNSALKSAYPYEAHKVICPYFRAILWIMS